jgi:hypothetical protein
VRDEKGKRAELPQIMSDLDMLAVCIRLTIREKLKKNEKVKIHRPSTQYGHSSFLLINAVLNLNFVPVPPEFALVVITLKNATILNIHVQCA